MTICFAVMARAQSLDQTGVTLLRAVTTNLDGSGISVAQPEAYDQGVVGNWEVNPTNSYGQRPVGIFTYTSASGTANNFPNAVGNESGHADAVMGNFYGMPWGVATNTPQADNYDANYFIGLVQTLSSIPGSIVNQSFTTGTTNGESTYDTDYDNYAWQYKTLFVSGAGNGGPVLAPSTCYNGLSVGCYGPGASSSVGPTPDGGRCKPDITSPGWPALLTSFSTPVVAGAAAVLMQAGLRGDGGGTITTNSAADIRTVKALLLNGAVKPSDWTNASFSPLDARYGAGIVNAFNSYAQLAGGRQGYDFSTNVPNGTAHPPVVMTNAINAWSGWDFNTNSSTSTKDGVNHYFFNVTNAVSNATFSVTATLVWLRQQNQSAINNLNLFLYNAANSNLVACSTSLVDNVEHIYVPKLARGRYDLQVWKAAGTPGITIVSASEAYALAFNFAPPFIAQNGKTVAVTWPAFWGLDTSTNLAAAWSLFTGVPTVAAYGQNQLIMTATNPPMFFRLHRH